MLSKPAHSVRRCKSFTGEVGCTIPVGATLAEHVAWSAEVPPSDVLPDFVQAHQEDRRLVAHLEQYGYRLRGVRISAASELVGTYSRGGSLAVGPADLATLCVLPWEPRVSRKAVLEEVSRVTGYRDDYPYY